MGIPYLNSDESIILSTHNIIADTDVSEAILTNRRLLIVDSNSTRSHHKEIPFAAIETVTTMESGSGDPAISLAVLKKSGGTVPLYLIFTQSSRSSRTVERDAWAQGIKEQIALLPSGTLPECVDFSEDEGNDLKKLIGYEAGAAPASEEEKNFPVTARQKSKTPLSSRFHPQASAASSKNMLMGTTAIVVVILLIACAAFIYPAFMSPKTNTLLPPITPAPTTAATQLPITTPTLSPEPTLVPADNGEQTPDEQPLVVTTPQLQTSVPVNGVWVRIGYEGDYTGSIGSGGRMREVSGTGGRFYQVPAISTDIIQIAIQKLDTTGIPLTVEVFNNGVIIQRKMIITPKGTLGMTVDLKIAQTMVITPTLTP